MRNFKKVVALVLALVMVLSINVPSFAAEMTAAEQATTLELLKGTNNTVDAEYLAKVPTRIQAAIVTLRLRGLEADAIAYEGTEVFADHDEIGWAEGKAIASYLKANPELGWVGTGDDMLKPNAAIDAQSYVKVMLEALGYKYNTDFTWAEVFTFAADKGLTALTAETDMTNDALAVGAVDALKATNMDGEVLLDKLIADGAIMESKAIEAGLKEEVTELAVESVMAVNNRQVEIKFNKAVDSTTALDEANYEIKDKGTTAITLGASSAALSADKMTVTITLDNDITDMLTNSTNAKVTVKKAIKDADGVALAADYVDDAVVVFDGIAPEATAVAATGLKTLEVTFSEPIYDGTDATFTAGNFEVKSGSYTYFVNSATAVDNVLTLGVGTNLQEGAVTVTFNKLAEIQDYAGIKAFQGSIGFDYVKDTTTPVASVKEATQTSVTIAFDKPVNATGLKLYHSVSGVANYGDTQNVAAAKEVTFSYAVNKLPQGNVNLYLVNSTTAGQEVTDLYGNKMADTTFVVSITVDSTPPTVAETKLNTNASFDVTFSENIDTAEAKTANFTVKKVSDASDVAFVVTNDGAKKVTLTFNSALTDNTDYEVTVKSMKDTTGNVLAAESSYVINAGDNTHPTVASSYITDAKTAFIVFSEDMNATDIVNKSLYIVDGVALDSADTLEAVSAKKVKITFNDGGLVGGTSDIILGALRDLAGKALVSATTFSTTLTNVAADTLELEKAELTAANKVKLTFSKELANFDNTEFAIRQTDDGAISTGAVAIASVESMSVNSDGKSEVVIVLDKNLQTDAKDVAEAIEVWTVDTPANTKSVENTVLSADDAKDEVTIADKLGGAIKVVSDKKVIETRDSDANGKIDYIVVQYDEAVKPATLSLLSYEVAGYTVTAVAADVDGADETASGAGAYVILTVTEKATVDAAVTPNVTQLLDIQDVAGNTMVKTDALASQDKVVPLVTSVVIGGTADDAVTAGDTITITFNEATDKPTITQASFGAGVGAPVFGTTGQTFVWDAAGKVLTITIGTAGVDLLVDDTIVLAAVDTVEDAAGNDFGTGTIYTMPANLVGSDW